MDMALAASFAIAMLSWWAWRETRRRGYLVLFYLFMALGMLAKGPVAPLLAVLIIAGYALAARDWRGALRMFWIPGIFLFCAIALPWYVLVQARNPAFFHTFILEHNFGRFSQDLFHHREPFWYYLPVTGLALVPWVVFVSAALVQTSREWWAEFQARNTTDAAFCLELRFSLFACSWLIVPIVFFSISQSKLPGYILPAVPAGAVLLASYLWHGLKEEESGRAAKWLIVLHALAATVWIVPALLVAYLVTQHRLPAGQPMFVALAVAFVLAGGIALTLVSRQGLRMLRFVTLIPVVLAVGAVLKLGSASLDQTLSARPLAQEIRSVEMGTLPLAVYGVPRELEYGLTFYRNRLTIRYEWGSVPPEQHLLVAPEGWRARVAEQAPEIGRAS